MHNFRKFACCLLCTLLLICLLTINYYPNWNQQTNPTLVYGTPVQFLEDLDIDAINIDQIADDDDYLYLLDAHKGILRVFDLNGNYLYTLMFYDYVNGAFKLAVKNSCLYVSDPHGNVYVFAEGEFNQFIERDDAKKDLENVDFEKSSTNYVIRSASVWKVCETGDICVIERSLSSIRYQRRIFIPIFVGLVFVFAFIRFFSGRRKRD